MSGSALRGKKEPTKYYFLYPMRYDYLINVTHKNTYCSYFGHFGWHFIQLSIFNKKIAQNVGPLCEHRHGGTFSIHWQQYR